MNIFYYIVLRFILINNMDMENYLDHLSNGLLDLQEMIENIDGSGLNDSDKRKAVDILNKKYDNLLKIFKKNVLKYCNS